MRSALRLVWALDVRHLIAHRTRLALSTLGIAVGVALAVGVGAVSSSIQGSLEAIAQAAASDANIEIRPNGRAGLPPRVLSQVRGVAGVRAAGAVVESYVQVRTERTDARVLLLGIDQGIIAMSPQAVDPETVRTADPFGLWLPSALAQDLGAEPGDEIEVTTPQGWKKTMVGAVLPTEASERSRIVVGAVGVVQELLGKPTGFDVVYVEARDPEAALARVQRAIGSVGRAGPVALRSDQLQQLLAGANASFGVGSIVALFVGAFLVYNTMSMAAVERLREAALLRAVGAKRRQVFALFCAEGGLLGIVGSLLGLGGGLLLSAQLLSQQGGALEQIYPIQISRVDIEPSLLIAAGIAGVVSSLVAAYLPARRVARADPAPALGPSGVLEDPTRGPRRATTLIALACCIVGPVLAITTLTAGAGAPPATLVGFAITLSGIALLIPTGVPAIARVLLSGVSRFRYTPGIVRLAAGEVLRAPGRTAFTVGAVLLSLAIVVGFSVGQSSYTRAFFLEFENILSTDLYVRTATWRPLGSDVPLDESVADEIEAIPGVVAAWPFRLMPATLDDKSIIVITYDLEKYAHNIRGVDDIYRARRLAEARALREQGTVLATPSLTNQLGYEIGDVIRLPTPTGIHKLRIVGEFPDPSAINPELVFDHDEFKRVWGTGGSDNFGVRIEDPDKVTEMQRKIEAVLGPRYGIQVDTAAQYRERVAGIVTSITQLISSVQLVAVVVAALGLANTLLISTLERRRDIGVLRAVGMLRRQLRRMVGAEAVMIGTLGVLLAWILGTAIGYGIYRLIEAQLGLPLDFAPPLAAYLGSGVLGVVSALLASLYPAHRAARIDVVEALQYE